MATRADLDLWHDYLKQVKAFFPPVSPDDGYRVYAAPLTTVGITAGRAIGQAIINHDLFRIGDFLLPVNSPVFLPGPSYSQRLLRYLQAVELTPGRQDASALAALQAATTTLQQQTDNYLKSRTAAFKAYQQDPEFEKTTFEDWALMNYPPYQLARSQKDAASQLAYQACQNYYGPQTDQLWSDKAMVQRAFSDLPNPPYNMPTSMAQVTPGEVVGSQVPPSNPADIKYEPRYFINSNFSNIVIGWVLTADNPRNAPIVIQFSSSDAKAPANPESAFEDLGFSSAQMLDDDDIAPLLPLFTADYGGSGSEPSSKLQVGVGNAKNNASVSVTITASAASVFDIAPDSSWNVPDVATKYKLQANAPNDLREPLVLVTSILLGYQVSVTMTTTDPTLFKTIDTGLTQAENAGGTATLFGLSVGPNSSQSMVGFQQVQRNVETRTITIPPRDNSQLTLLGLMGRKLATSAPD